MARKISGNKSLTSSVTSGVMVDTMKKKIPWTPSGRFMQRVGKSLHRKLRTMAEKDGVSLNRLVESILSEKIGEKHREAQ